MKPISLLLLSFFTCFLSRVSAQAQTRPEFTTFDAPGAGIGATQGTFPNGVNSGGAVAAWYIDPGNVYHSFLRTSDGTITTFDAPGAGTGAGQGTIAFGMNPERAITGFYAMEGTFVSNVNPEGAIVGYYVDTVNVAHGYVRDRNGAFTNVDVPGAGSGSGQGTFSIGNNPAGAVTGYYVDANGVAHGFLGSR
jgi:hypothetical protein